MHSQILDIHNKMSNLFNIFSTREIALAIWGLIFLIFVSRTKDVRHSIVEVIKAFFDKKIIHPFIILLLYMLLVIFLLSYIGFGDISLLKETLLWILSSGILLFVNINKVENINYFSKIIKDNIKIITIWEFLFNFYTLSLVGELIFIPIIFLFTSMEAFAENSSKQKDSYKKVVSLCKNILGLIGLSMVFYVIYKTIIGYKLLFSVSNFKSFLLPILLVTLALPYFYALALYTNYENFITVVKLLHRNEEPRISKSLIKATLIYANININTLQRIRKYLVHFDSSKENPNEYIRRISKKTQYVISDKAKFTPFNDIRTVIKSLSNIGVGKLDEWHKSYVDDDGYLSMTNYYQFGIDDITKMPNTLAFYLIGEKNYIKQLEIVLDVGYQQDNGQAIEKLIEVLGPIFNSLDTTIPEGLTNSIIENREYNKQYYTHSVSFNYEKFEKIETYILSITTQ